MTVIKAVKPKEDLTGAQNSNKVKVRIEGCKEDLIDNSHIPRAFLALHREKVNFTT